MKQIHSSLRKSNLSLAFVFVSLLSFSQNDSLPVKDDSLYVAMHLNVLGIPQGEIGPGFEIIFKKFTAIELGIGKTWENYKYSILETRKTYDGYLGEYNRDEFDTKWEGSIFRNWTFNLVVSQYFNVSKNVLPFVSAEYKWKNVFSVVRTTADPALTNIDIFNSIAGRQERTSNKFSLYGGISTNRKYLLLKLYAGVFYDFRSIEYPNLVFNDQSQINSFEQEFLTDQQFGVEIGLKIGLGIRVSEDELIGDE